MKKTALITGASSGIGLELAKIHASKGDNLVLVARNLTKLEELKQQLEQLNGVNVHVIEKDLSLEDSTQQIFDETREKNIQIDFLINNAGFGDFGLFFQTQWLKESQMINLNITALTHLCKLYIPEMMQQGAGKILNVASTAAFQPGPTMAIYYATKAYVLHFSEAIGNELKGTNITVTALCPGATESGFQKVAAMEESNLVKDKKLPTAKTVAKYGYQSMMKGKAVAIHGLKNYLLANSVRFSPRAIVVKLARKIQDKV